MSANEIMQVSIKESYEITQTVDANGEVKYQRKAVYQPFSSITPETKEQKIAMMNLLNGDTEGTSPLGENIGKQIKLSDVIFQPYDKVDEKTGEMEFGVLSYLITPDGTAYVTSSKSVYFTLKRAFQVFGEPHYNEDELLTVQPIKKKGQNFQYTDLKILG